MKFQIDIRKILFGLDLNGVRSMGFDLAALLCAFGLHKLCEVQSLNNLNDCGFRNFEKIPKKKVFDKNERCAKILNSKGLIQKQFPKSSG